MFLCVGLIIVTLHFFGDHANCAEYKVITYTANKYWSGTGAKVWISIRDVIGELSDSIQLQSDSSNFQVGGRDEFTISIKKGLGKRLASIRIGHDNTGSSPAWLLKKVEVVTPEKETFVFPVNIWLDAKLGTHAIAKTVTQPDCGLNSSPRVIFGRDASPNQWPWQAQIKLLTSKYGKRHHCGGTLIHPEYILTAAHCVRDEKSQPKDYVITLGEHSLSKDDGTEQVFRGKKIFSHPDFTMKTVDSDLAIIKLDKPALINAQVKPACLPKHGYFQGAGKECVVSGWGQNGYWEYPDVLQQAPLPTASNEQCTKLMVLRPDNLKITKNMLCAGQNWKLACNGDSGGPLVCLDDTSKRYILQGSVSWGKASCDAMKFYSVFARVANFVDWIHEQISDVKYD